MTEFLCAVWININKPEESQKQEKERSFERSSMKINEVWGACPGVLSGSHQSRVPSAPLRTQHFRDAFLFPFGTGPHFAQNSRGKAKEAGPDPRPPHPLRAGPCLPPARGPAPRITRPPPAAALTPPGSLRRGTPRGRGGRGLAPRSSPAVGTSREAGAASGAGRDRERSREGGGERGGGAGLVCAAEGSEGRSAVMGGGGRAKMAAPCGPEEPGVVNS